MEDIFDLKPNVKLYNETSIRVGTFLGGPLIAGYLMAENYKKLEDFSKVKNAWVISIAITVLLYAAIFFIPAIERIPRYFIPLAYSVIASLVFQKYQGTQVKSHIEKGGLVYSTWRGVLVGFIGFLIMAAIILGVLFLTYPDLL